MKPSWQALLVAYLASTCLSGCAVGPDYHAPTLPLGSDAPLLSTGEVADSADAPPDQWWRLYDDPRLDALIQEAFAENTNLRAAEANLKAAKALVDGARAGLYPSTAMEYGSIRGRDASTDEILHIVGQHSQTVWLHEAVFEASYEVDLFGRVRRGIEASRANSESIAAARDLVKIEVAAQTTKAYAEICALGEQIDVTQHSLQVAGKQAEITSRRRDAGAGSDFDVVREDTFVAQVKSTLPPLEGQRRATLAQLAVLLGKTPSQAPRDVLSCVHPPKLKSLIPVGDGTQLLKRRPDIREADRRLAAVTALIGVAKADLYPTVRLGGLFGGASSHFNELTAGGSSWTWGIGPSVSWSFPNLAAPIARVHQAEANESATVAAFDSTVLGALRELEQALQIYSSELERHQYLSEAQDNARRAFKLAQGQLDAGAVSSLDLLNSENTLVSADASVAASDSALIQDQIAVFKALGGGWQDLDHQADEK